MTRPAAVGDNQRVALLARIVTARGRRAGGAPDPFTICHHERVVHPFKASVNAPDGTKIVSQGGKFFGSRRHGQPARTTV